MLPLTINKRLSNWLKISDEGWWIVLTTLRPWRARFFKTSSTFKAVVESRPVVGSSRKSKLGLVISSTPIEVLFLSPPDKPLIKVFPTFVSAHFWRPSSLIKLSTLCFFSSLLNFNLKFAVKLKTSIKNDISNIFIMYLWGWWLPSRYHLAARRQRGFQ